MAYKSAADYGAMSLSMESTFKLFLVVVVVVLFINGLLLLLVRNSCCCCYCCDFGDVLRVAATAPSTSRA